MRVAGMIRRSRQQVTAVAPRPSRAHPPARAVSGAAGGSVRQISTAPERAAARRPWVFLQAKLEVGGVDDPLEHEADRVADQVMRMPDPGVSATAPPQVSRKCAACEEEGDEELQTKRTPSSSAEPVLDVDAAARAAARPGEPLSAETRSYFEPRFAHDFRQVRIHADGEAAIAAGAVRAQAYTIGRDIVFGAGQYAPETEQGRRLIAHELVHVAQQGTSARMSGGSVDVTPSHGKISREGPIEMEIDPDCPPDMICFTILNGNQAHKALSQQDKQAIVANAGGAIPTGPGPTFSKDGPRFVLHDTATSFGPPKKEAQHLADLKAQGSTPVGEGPAAFVTAAGAPERTHSKFFNAQRPTATEFERANDLMDLFGRETAMQQIWSLTAPAAQSAASSSFLALFPGMSAKDIKDETAKAIKNLDSSKTQPSSKAGAKAVVMTTATGAVSQICDIVAAGGAAKVALAGQDAALTKACAGMKPVYDARKTRIADTTNIEIIADKGSDCDASSSAKPFSGYAPAAYDAVAKLYALAALEAGQFPEITTHYYLDSTTPAGSPGAVTKAQNRCDPRCFDLDLLYAKIAAILNHPAGTTYGIAPSYGTKFGTSTVWWPTNVCGPLPGTPAAGSASPPAKQSSSPKKKQSK